MPFFSLAWALLVSQPSGALEIPRFRLISAGKKCNLFSSVLICLYLFFFFLFFFFFSPFSGLQPQDKSKDLYWF